MRKNKEHREDSGITLLEIMIVLVISFFIYSYFIGDIIILAQRLDDLTGAIRICISMPGKR
jgi:hypothetical protein